VVGEEIEGEEISQSVICAIFQFGESSKGNKFDRSVQCFRGFEQMFKETYMLVFATPVRACSVRWWLR